MRGDVLLGVGDDAAVMCVPPDRRLVAATDTIIEGVHFPHGAAAYDIGYRALAVNLSDMAAMGAEPAWMTLSLGLPKVDAQWLQDFSAGLYELAERHNVALVGGDTVRGELSITVQIMGLVETDKWLTRGGAQVGDAIFVSGSPGEAAAGLSAVLKDLPRSTALNRLRSRFWRPEPRVALGRAIRPFASACIDVSDGVLADLGHICERSGVGAHIDMETLPISQSLREAFSRENCERFLLAGGDDYELLFTVPGHLLSAVKAAVADGAPCAAIGSIVAGNAPKCFRGGVEIKIEKRGFDHFV